MFWRIYTYVAAGRFKEWRLKTGFLRRTIKLLADPAIARVTRTHSSRATLGKALIALWWPVQKEHMVKSGVVCGVCSEPKHTVHVHCGSVYTGEM